MKYRVGSLFAGIGGICEAFSQAGCEIAWANEFNRYACQTYRLNFKHKLHECDIRSIADPKSLGEVDIITSGFPCQAFSIAGHGKGFKDDKGRGDLFFETARFIRTLNPKAFLLENVRNLVSHDHGNTFKVICETLTSELGYSFIPFILNAKDYGVPQVRERTYIVGFRQEKDCVCRLNAEPQDYIDIDADKCRSSVLFKMPKKTGLNRNFRDLLSDGKQDDKYYYQKSHKYYNKLNETVQKEGAGSVYQWRRVYVRRNKSACCPTLTANMGGGGHNVPIVVDDFGIRKLTPLECLRFQGFPKRFSFPPDMADSHRYMQAGNSVVVPVVKLIAEAVVEAMNGDVRVKA
jgi:DNA (cytosine-5)-methyltransferase 1